MADADPRLAAMATLTRADAGRVGLRLEAFTVAWMAAEAGLAIAAGVLARSVLLTAFGFDSVIELVSGAVLFWRFRVEVQGRDADRVEAAERQVERIAAMLLVLLCAYVLITSAVGLALRAKPEGSALGLVVAAAAVLVMPLLARRKRRLDAVLNSAALRADIVETMTCAYMAAATLTGVALNLVFGWWWADYVGALVLLVWLLRETREAIAEVREAGGHQH